ncbi:unnamed protein product, partial [Brassica oleracea]
LVSLSLSHVKVEVDLTKPLPSVVEFERQSGEVVEVLVSYPWLPPTCSHCKELGHIARNCLKLPVPPAAPPGKGKGSMRKPDKKETKEKSAPQVQYVAVKDHNTKKPLGEAESGSATVNLSSPRTPFSKDSQSIPLPMDTENSFSIPKSTTRKPHHKKPSQTSISSSPNPFSILNTPQSSPDPPRPSLKRSRSSPTLSPPPPPFIKKPLLCLLPLLTPQKLQNLQLPLDPQELQALTLLLLTTLSLHHLHPLLASQKLLILQLPLFLQETYPAPYHVLHLSKMELCFQPPS